MKLISLAYRFIVTMAIGTQPGLVLLLRHQFNFAASTNVNKYELFGGVAYPHKKSRDVLSSGNFSEAIPTSYHLNE